MSFGEAVSTVYTKKYATFSGRARRSEYWWVYLFNTIVAMVLNILTAATHSNAVQILLVIFGLAVLIPGLAVTARRLHDTGRTGWWILIGLVPLVGAIVLLVFIVGDSQPGPNAYGPPVKNVDAYPVTV